MRNQAFATIVHLRFAKTPAVACFVMSSLWCCGLSAALPASEKGNPLALPPTFRTALEAQGRTLSPIRVIWEDTLKPQISVEELKSSLGFNFPSSIFEPTTVTYMLTNGKYYTKRIMKQDNPRHPSSPVTVEAEQSFDGLNFYSGNRMSAYLAQGARPVLVITPRSEPLAKNPDHFLPNAEYLERAGFHVPRTYRESGNDAQSLIMYRIGRGDGISALTRVSIDGHDCMAIEFKTGDRISTYTIDPSLNYALRRQEERAIPDGKLLEQTDCSEFVSFAADRISLPRRCDVSQFTWSTTGGRVFPRPILMRSFVVTEIDKNPIAADQFVLSYNKAGTVIGDGSLPEAKSFADGKVTYVVPANPADLDAAVAAARQGKTFYSQLTSRSSVLIRMLWINLALIVAIAAGLIWYRLKRKK
jgi:hypothetical protein